MRDIARSVSNKTLVIVPTYNERDNLPTLAERILSQPGEVELLVVDDNSPDGTGKLADEYASNAAPPLASKSVAV